MIKKLISFILVIVVLFGISVNVYANENQGITYNESKKAKEDGYIGQDITYEDWKILYY